MQASGDEYEVSPSEFVFGDERAFAQCHGATVVAIPGGRTLVAWFAGTHEGHDDVAIWAAVREAAGDASASAPGLRWSRPRRIARIAEEPHWNPVLFALDEDGERLVLHFKVGRSIRRWRTFAQTSSDGGESWSAAGELVPGDRGGRGAVRSRPIRLHSGDWLAGASIERWRRWDAFFDRSPDGVSSWRRTPLLEGGRARGGKGLIQPSLWESEPGHVHALLRSTDGHLYRADSEDDGQTWSPARPTALPNNNSAIDVVRTRRGSLALACNPVGGNWGPRAPLSLLLSHDDGRSWPDRIDLETGAGEFSYPALIAHEDALLVAYTWNRRRIAWTRIAEADQPTRPDS